MPVTSQLLPIQQNNNKMQILLRNWTCCCCRHSQSLLVGRDSYSSQREGSSWTTYWSRDFTSTCHIHTAQLGDWKKALRDTPNTTRSNESHFLKHSELLPIFVWLVILSVWGLNHFELGQAKYTCTFTNYSANLYLVQKHKQLSPTTGIALMHLEVNGQEITCYFRTTNHKLRPLNASRHQ